MSNLRIKIYVLVIIILLQSNAYAAAPDDITTNQRAWFDAVDINANNDYTDNPANNAAIAEWSDKSGSGNHISTTGTQRPLYKLNSIGIDRNGVDFDGINDALRDTSDIWTGSVTHSEIFIFATTDQIKNSFIFASFSGGNNRLGAHIPWGNSRTYFDQGNCCGNPTRLQGNIPITLSEHYFWHFIGLPSQQSIVRDGTIQLNDSGASVYNTSATSSFTFGAQAAGGTHGHHGRVFESLFYQTALNNAQRRIINSYLSAKWNKAFGPSPNYADVYAGDSPSNGNYDFFVGGIGQDNGLQSTGTSQGLTITNSSFLNANGKFVLAGVNYLTSTPISGLSTADLPTSYNDRSNRTWYIDSTGTGGLVNLSFNASEIGVTAENGSVYGLLHRTGTSGVFTEVATATMSSGIVTFSHLPVDGIYSIGKRNNEEVILEIKKTLAAVSDPINNTTNPKSIPGALIDYTLTVQNQGTGSTDADTVTISDTLSGNLTLFTGDLNGSGNPFIYTDNSCLPVTSTKDSNLSISYPTAVTFKDSLGNIISPSSDFDMAIRSFEIAMTGAFSGSDASNTACFTLQYRTRIE